MSTLHAGDNIVTSEHTVTDSALGDSIFDGFDESIVNLFDISPDCESVCEVNMTTKINVPLLDKSSSYEAYKKELNGWRRITKVDKKDQGYTVALSLPYVEDGNARKGGKQDIRTAVFEQMTDDDLTADDGLDKLIEFMDEKLGSDPLIDKLEKFEDFEDWMAIL